MINVRVEKKPGFRTIGRKTWIGGPDNDSFGLFWEQCKREGLLGEYWRIYQKRKNSVTLSAAIGISSVEKDPQNRGFYFYIATECEEGYEGLELEEYYVPACEWAIFENRGSMPGVLIDAEMYAIMEWLPASGYVHADAPELEVYPVAGGEDGTLVEFWLPIRSNHS